MIKIMSQHKIHLLTMGARTSGGTDKSAAAIRMTRFMMVLVQVSKDVG
jgi:hypothetical protein